MACKVLGAETIDKQYQWTGGWFPSPDKDVPNTAWCLKTEDVVPYHPEASPASYLCTLLDPRRTLL